MISPLRWLVLFASLLAGWSADGPGVSCSPMNTLNRSRRWWGSPCQNHPGILSQVLDEEPSQAALGQKEGTNLECEEDIYSAQLTSKVKMWPPWPLNLLQRSRNNPHIDDETSVAASSVYPSAAAQFWAYFKQRTRIGVRQIQEVGSQVCVVMSSKPIVEFHVGLNNQQTGILSRFVGRYPTNNIVTELKPENTYLFS